MDREILFKGKRIDTEEWIEGYYFKMDETTYAFAEDYEKYPVPVHHYIVSERMSDWGLPNRAHFQEVKPETVCQYTGLTDRNDRKIFEGDIVQDYPFKAVVKFGEFECQVLKNIGFNLDWLNKLYYRQDLLYWVDKIEVVGNIFDNPELLQDDAGNSCERK